MSEFPAMHIKTEHDTLVLRTGAAERIFEYKGFHYRPESAQSFIDIIEAKGDVCCTVIFVNDNGASAILDDSVTDREQDTVSYSHSISLAAKEWVSVINNNPDGMVFGIKSLADFLKRRPEGEVPDLDKLLYAVQNFKYVTNVEGDFSFEDRNNYTFGIKIKEAEGTVKVPKLLTARLELLEGSGFVQDIEIEVEVRRPKG